MASAMLNGAPSMKSTTFKREVDELVDKCTLATLNVLMMNVQGMKVEDMSGVDVQHGVLKMMIEMQSEILDGMQSRERSMQGESGQLTND